VLHKSYTVSVRTLRLVLYIKLPLVFHRRRELRIRIEKLAFLSSLDVSLGSDRFDGIEENDGESFTTPSTVVQVGSLEVIVKRVGCTRRARIARVIREKGRNKPVNGLWTFIPWPHLRRGKLGKCESV